MRGNNHIIGKYIIKGDFRRAAESIQEPEITEWLSAHPNDFVGALKRLPKKVLQIYLHSYQSHLWNMAAIRYNEKYPKKHYAELKVPGFGEVHGTAGDDIVENILASESIDPRDFIIRQMPELSMEAGKRKLFAEIKNLTIGPLLPDELGQKRKVMISFCLDKGSYATLAVKSMF